MSAPISMARWRRPQACDAEQAGEPQDAEAGSEALLGVRPLLQDGSQSAAVAGPTRGRPSGYGRWSSPHNGDGWTACGRCLLAACAYARRCARP